MAKVRYDWDPELPMGAVWLVHESYTEGYETMLGHEIGMGLASDVPPLPGAVRYFSGYDDTLAFYLAMLGSPWRIHSRCGWCFSQECRKLPI